MTLAKNLILFFSQLLNFQAWFFTFSTNTENKRMSFDEANDVVILI